MAKGASFLAISLFFAMSVYSQNILMDISKYDLDKIEKQTIKKTRKLLKTDKERHLSVFTYFAVGLSDYFFREAGIFDDYREYFKLFDKKIGTIDDFFKYFKLYDKENIDDFLKNFKLWDKYRCYVYDDSLNIVAMSIEQQIFSFGNTTPDNRYIEYITRINPEYIFEYIYCPASCPVYFCYKDGGIIIVRLSDDSKNIVSYPLSELKDWQRLYDPVRQTDNIP
ncbi:hypothetical protein FACS189413_18990 [Bacteroidia bacterium]|nr:hypothetical protein FACS189413_18990 [Bacteroidia bacterium]